MCIPVENRKLSCVDDDCHRYSTHNTNIQGHRNSRRMLSASCQIAGHFLSIAWYKDSLRWLLLFLYWFGTFILWYEYYHFLLTEAFKNNWIHQVLYFKYKEIFLNPKFTPNDFHPAFWLLENHSFISLNSNVNASVLPCCLSLIINLGALIKTLHYILLL